MRSILIIFFLLPISLFGQVQAYLGREDSDTIPERYKLETNILREHIYSTLPGKLKVDFKMDRRCLLFAQEASIQINSLISGGNLYSDWPELEDYLNLILQRVMPNVLKGDTNIHVYVARDGQRNAYMLPSGHIIMNIGFIADASSEAMIAATFLHELAHYYKQHSVYTYLQAVKSSYDGRHFYNSRKFQKNSVKSETQADSLAMSWMLSTGYSLNGLKWFFETASLENRNLIARYKDVWVLEERTHPLPDDRLKAVQNFLDSHPEHTGTENLENESLFSQFRTSARIESLKYLIRSLNYYDCIESAFKYHLFEPGNAGYMYYLLESIRRQCYLNRKIWNENFITNRYYVRDSSSIKSIKKRMDLHLFKSYSPKLLSIPDSDTLLIKTRRYWNGDPDFVTYEQAFVYFYNLSQLQQMHEAVLSNALSLSHNVELRNKFLKKYLEYENIRHREYAQKLLADSIYSTLDTNRLIVLIDFETIIKLSKEELLLSRQPTDSIDHIEDILNRTVKEFPGWNGIQLKNLVLDHAKDAQLLFNIYQFSKQITVSTNEQFEMAVLDPEIWEQFRKHNVSQVEFFNCQYADPGGLRRNAESYRGMIEEGITPLFYPPARQRFMKLEITSLGMTNKGRTKMYLYDTTTFGNIMTSVPEVAKEMAEMLRIKDKKKTGEYYLILDE